MKITEAQATRRSRTLSRAQLGLDAPEVIVETHLAGGLPAFTLVGLPETAVREARDRVRGAMANCGFDFPDGRIVVNLAPADLLKEGGRFDLAIAISILRATGQLREPTPAQGSWVFLGELSLAGELRSVRGCLCAALSVDPAQTLIVPLANATEARAAGRRVTPLAHLRDVCTWLTRADQRPALTLRAPPLRTPELPTQAPQVIGQGMAKRALAIAAAGRHHLLMVGPPGSGKSLLARTLPAMLPALEEEEAMQVAAVYSAAGLPRTAPATAPFRDPHHSASSAALVGGGSQPRPGEISLAHHGVLFLDELPHFKPSVLDALREPLETGSISIVRAGWRASFPARFQLLAAMNPCPAGLICTPGTCRCRPDQVQRYTSRVSGPLLDRLDMHVSVPEVPRHLLLEGCDPEPPPGRGVIVSARRRQQLRQGKTNAELSGAELTSTCDLKSAGRALLGRAAERYRLSARGVHRVLRVSRTIADLEACPAVSAEHLTEALSYRAMSWGSTPGAGQYD